MAGPAGHHAGHVLPVVAVLGGLVVAVVALAAVREILGIGDLGVVDAVVEHVELLCRVDLVDHVLHVALALGEVGIVAVDAVLGYETATVEHQAVVALVAGVHHHDIAGVGHVTARRHEVQEQVLGFQRNSAGTDLPGHAVAQGRLVGHAGHIGDVCIEGERIGAVAVIDQG